MSRQKRCTATALTAALAAGLLGGSVGAATPALAADTPAQPTMGAVRTAPLEDAHVDSAAPTRAFGTATALSAGVAGTASRTAFLKVRVPAIPEGAVVTGSRLELVPTRSQTGEVRVHDVPSTSWSEAAVTASTAPALGALLASRTVSAPEAKTVIPLGTAVQPGTTRTYAVVLPAGANDFASREAGATGPRLVVAWMHQAPQAPQLTGDLAGDDAQLSWPAVTGATSYVVTRDGEELPALDGTSLVDPDRPAGSTSTYAVRATGPGGTSAPSAEVVLSVAPDAPVLTGTVVDGDDASLSWTAPAGATGYRVVRTEDGSVVATGQATTAVDADRPAGSTTTYAVQALGTGGSSAASNAVDLSVAPGKPALTVRAGDGAAALSWTAQDGATSYVVTRNGTTSWTVSGTSAVDPREDGSTTTYQVQAVGAGGAGAASDPAAVTLAPAAPVLAGDVAGRDDAVLTWAAVRGATSYAVTRDGVVVHTGPELTFTDADRPVFSTATYRVTATNRGGSSEPSSPVALATAPEAPVLRGSVDRLEHALSWTASDGAAGYAVVRDGEVVWTGTATSVVLQGEPRATASYVVRATNESGATPSAKVALTSPGTMFGTNADPYDGETVTQAYARRVRDYGQPAVQRVFSPGLPGSWDKMTSFYQGTQLHTSFRLAPKAVLSGQHDAALRTFFATAPKDRTTWWTLNHEPEISVKNGEYTAAEYRAAQVHIDKIADSVGNPRLRATLVLMCWTVDPRSGRTWSDYYAPEHVDVLSWDCYNIPTNKPGTFQDPHTIFGQAIEVTRAAGEDFAVAEFGSTLMGGYPAARAQWIKDVARYLDAQGAVYANYWDNKTPTGNDHRLLGDSLSIAALRSVQADQIP